jgi:hypothetical protein
MPAFIKMPIAMLYFFRNDFTYCPSTCMSATEILVPYAAITGPLPSRITVSVALSSKVAKVAFVAMAAGASVFAIQVQAMFHNIIARGIGICNNGFRCFGRLVVRFFEFGVFSVAQQNYVYKDEKGNYAQYFAVVLKRKYACKHGNYNKRKF